MPSDAKIAALSSISARKPAWREVRNPDAGVSAKVTRPAASASAFPGNVRKTDTPPSAPATGGAAVAPAGSVRSAELPIPVTAATTPAIADTGATVAEKPTTHTEAVAVRNELIDHAMSADFDVAELGKMIEDPAADPAVIGAWGLARKDSEQSWDAVANGFAQEIALAPRRDPGGIEGSDPAFGASNQPTNYVEDVLANEAFDPVFEDKIAYYARLGAQIDLTPVTAETFSGLEGEYLDPIEEHLEAGETEEAIGLLEALDKTLGNDPVVTDALKPDLDGTVDPDKIETFQTWKDTALEPIYAELSAQAPGYIADIAGTSSREQRPERVMSGVSRLVNVLPDDRVADVVEATEPTWGPVIEDDLMFSVQEAGNAAGFHAAVGDTVEIYDRLARSPDAEEALGRLGDAIVAAWDDQYAAGNSDTYLLATEIGQAVGVRQGAFLAVDRINRFADGGRLDDYDRMVASLADGIEVFGDSAISNLVTAGADQEQILRIAQNFANLSTEPGPGQLDLTELELRLALQNHVDRHPEIYDHVQEVNRDAVAYKRLLEALAGLSLEAQVGPAVTGPLEDSLRQFTASDEGGFSVQDFYAGTPSVQHELQQDAKRLGELLDRSDAPVFQPGALSDAVPGSDWLEYLADPLTHGVPRNIRFAANTLKDPKYGFPGIRSDAPPWKGGVTLFTAAGLQSGYLSVDATSKGHFLEGLQRASQGFAFSTLSAASSSDAALANFKAPYWRVLAFGSLLVASTVQLVRDYTSLAPVDREKLIIDWVSEAGGAALTLEASARFAASKLPPTSSALRPLLAVTRLSGWVGALIYAGTSIALYQYQRVSASNRFENADQREALAYFGSLQADGTPKPIIETSTRVDHDPEVGPADDVGSDRIVYRGLPVESVDILLNNDSDTDQPQNALGGIAALAETKGIAARDLVLSWYGPDSELSHEEQQSFALAALSVDPTKSGLSGEFQRRIRQNEIGSGNGKSASDGAIERSPRAVLFPGTPEELDAWLKLEGFPELPVTRRIVTRPPEGPAPVDPMTDVPRGWFGHASSSQPVAYQVQVGDNLWVIASNTSPQIALVELVGELNRNNPETEPDFDLALMDGDPFTPKAPGDNRRDPDLIFSGEFIRVDRMVHRPV